jgi:hypothetical protein
MKFSTRKDIDAPVEFVFGQFTDFDSLERQAIRHGISVQRTSGIQQDGIGATWTIQAPYRGKKRDVFIEVGALEAGEHVAVEVKSGGLNMTLDLQFVPLVGGRTRVIFGFDLRPQSLSAKILVQSLKIAKKNIQGRFERRVGVFCDTVEVRYAGARGA